MVERCWRYCVSATISVAMRIESMGYGLHGHDITVTACIDSPRRYDLEELRRLLEEALRPADHRALWEFLGRDEAMTEDLLVWLEERLNTQLQERGLALSGLRAALPSGEILIALESACRGRP